MHSPIHRLLLCSPGLACGLLLSLGLASAQVRAEQTLLVLGDSISAAYGIEVEQGWVQLLADRLTEEAHAITVVNASVSGETTDGGLARLPASLERHQPAIVVIELGGNDGLRGYPIERIRANLLRLVTTSQDAGAKVLLVGMFVPPNYGERYMMAFNNAFHEVAEQTGAELVPFLLEGVATDEQLMQDDGIHPQAAAQPLLLDNLWPTLSVLLKAPNEGGSE